MSRAFIAFIVFIEGFCSLGAEVIALRRLVPHIGSSIVVTAPTIGFFLLALALGYAAGARIDTDYRQRVGRNFFYAALLLGIGLSATAVDMLFTHLPPAAFAYLLFTLGILCPIAWLLGQTVPILTNLVPHTRSGEASGTALYWSTLGSFLGALSLSVLVMQFLGVGVAVLLTALLLGTGALVLAGPSLKNTLLGLLTVSSLAALNLYSTSAADTAYAEYRVGTVDLPKQQNPRAFWVNKSTASLIDDSDPPHYTRYIQHLRHILLDELGFKDKTILVLGAGGFTLSHREPLNHYTYVDIDPAIRDIAETHFLRTKANGRFIAEDARRFIRTHESRFDAVVVDVYSSHTAIPSHLLTQEFWQDTRRVLNPDGVLLANLILDGKLESPYARNALATLESVYGRCTVNVLHKAKTQANVEVTCFASSQPTPITIYRDERNPADADVARSR